MRPLNNLIEALRSGLPLISPNIKSGVSWINKHNETGYHTTLEILMIC